MSLKLTDITQWNVGAVVLEQFLLLLIAEKLNYFMTSLGGKNEVDIKFENSMHNYNATLVYWHHTLGCQCSSFGTDAVHKVGPVKQSKSYRRTGGQTFPSYGPFFII